MSQSIYDTIDAGSLPYVEALHEQYLQDPNSVPERWRAFFAQDDDATHFGPQFAASSIFAGARSEASGQDRPAWSDAPAAVPVNPAMQRRLPFLYRLRIFAELPEKALSLIANLLEEVTVAEGETIFEAGSDGDAVYFIERGRVEIQRAEEHVAFLGDGEVLGELSVMDNRPRSADAKAVADCSLLRLGNQDLYRLLDEHGAIARGLFHTVTQRLRETNARQERVDLLIRSYRVRGHVMANINPLGNKLEEHPELTLEHHGLSEADLDLAFSTRTYFHSERDQRLRTLVEQLKKTYCGSIGVQFMHIDNPEVKNWLYTRMEATQNRRSMSRDEQLRIFRKLTDAETFEDFIHKKYLGAKRFSLEGGETLIPLMDLALDGLARHGVRHAIIGMAHRGRLNVMTNIMGKSPAKVFEEFEDGDPQALIGRGDVKYHLGFSSVRVNAEGHRTQLSLCFNPSHLEFVAPVVCGRVRARQDRIGDRARQQVAGIVIHGDAAFAGQGVVQETLNMSGLQGYETGGTIHIIVNNQVGFTTHPEESRTSAYATDVAKMLDIPIFHVNGEDPDAVSHVINLACAFRAKWRRDVVIDMYCFRKYGHNEGDDPSFTQPLMYDNIRKRGTVRAHYLENLIKLGQITNEDAALIASASRERLEECLAAARSGDSAPETLGTCKEIVEVEEGCLIGDLGFEVYDAESGRVHAAFVGGADRACEEVDTTVGVETLQALLHQQLEVPEDFHINSKLTRLHKQRRAMATGDRPLDWGGAESLAFASLLTEGAGLRVSGQDSGRGTFAHRHAEWHDTTDGRRFIPLQNLSADQGKCGIWNSPLSETSVLAYEYGYSLEMPESLVIWEAQFGDFANGAQVIIDQFITSSEDKWNRLSGVVLLLPHGFEGQGPEHSSARLERFLTLAAEDNIMVMNLTTPAQLFHALRRHVMRKIRKPLVVMTPKSLLRHPQAISSLEELATKPFEKVIADSEADPSKVTRILLCSGKVYFELLNARNEAQLDHVAILRLEQLYPLPDVELKAHLAPYSDDCELVWVQEEPENMGAWGFFLRQLRGVAGRFRLNGVFRPESASPATGSKASHTYEQNLLMRQALGLEE